MLFRSEVVFKTILCVLLTIYTISLFVPILWGLMTTFKTQSNFRKDALGFPTEWTLKNYATALSRLYRDVQRGVTMVRVPFGTMFLYSLLYAGGCALSTGITTLVMSYVVARYPHFKISKVIYWIVLACMVMPVVGSLPAEINMAESFGFRNSFLGMFVMKMSFLGMYFLVLYATFKALPNDFAEAAEMDGAGELRIMLQIYFPLAKNAFFTVLLLYFIQYWNDYQIPLIYLPNYPTVAYGVFYFSNSGDAELANVPVKITACIIMLLPILTLFLAFHKRLLGNVTMGGIKE